MRKLREGSRGAGILDRGAEDCEEGAEGVEGVEGQEAMRVKTESGSDDSFIRDFIGSGALGIQASIDGSINLPDPCKALCKKNSQR